MDMGHLDPADLPGKRRHTERDSIVMEFRSARRYNRKMNPKTACVYCRVSSLDQASDETIVAQRERCAAIVRRHGLTVVRHVEDDGRSGTLLGERNFAILIEDLKKGKIKVDALVVYSLSRISRTDTTSDDIDKRIQSAADAARIVTVLSYTGITVIDEGGVKSPGTLAYTLEQEIGNQQHATIIKTTRTGRLSRLDRGQAAFGGKVLYGYKRVEDDTLGGWKLAVDDKNMANLLRILGWYADYGETEAARQAEAARIPVPRQKKRKKRAAADWTPYRWVRKTIRLIVEKLDMYLAGEIVRDFYGQPYRVKFPPLQLDPDLRARIELRRKSGTLKSPATHLTTGYVRCGDCGGGLHYMPGRISYLRCDTCKMAIAAHKIDASIKSAVEWRLIQIEIHERSERSKTPSDERVTTLERQIGQYTADISTLYEDRRAGLPADIWAMQNRKIVEARTAAERELAQVRADIEKAKTAVDQRRQVTDQIREIIDMTLDGGLDEWRKAIAAVTVGERITISWAKIEKKAVATVTLPAWGTLAPMTYRTDRPIHQQIRTTQDTSSPSWGEVLDATLTHRVGDVLDRAGIDRSLADRLTALMERTKAVEERIKTL